MVNEYLLIVDANLIANIIHIKDDRYFSTCMQNVEAIIDAIPIEPSVVQKRALIGNSMAKLLGFVAEIILADEKSLGRFNKINALMEKLYDAFTKSDELCKAYDSTFQSTRARKYDTKYQAFYKEFGRVLGAAVGRCEYTEGQKTEIIKWLVKLIDIWNRESEDKTSDELRVKNFGFVLESLMKKKQHELIEMIYTRLSMKAMIELREKEYDLPIKPSTAKIIDIVVYRLIGATHSTTRDFMSRVHWIRHIALECVHKGLFGAASRCIDALAMYFSVKALFDLESRESLYTHEWCRVQATLEFILILSDLHKYEIIKNRALLAIKTPVTELRNNFRQFRIYDNKCIEERAERIREACVADFESRFKLNSITALSDSSSDESED